MMCCVVNYFWILKYGKSLVGNIPDHTQFPELKIIKSVVLFFLYTNTQLVRVFFYTTSRLLTVYFDPESHRKFWSILHVLQTNIEDTESTIELLPISFVFSLFSFVCSSERFNANFQMIRHAVSMPNLAMKITRLPYSRLTLIKN